MSILDRSGLEPLGFRTVLPILMKDKDFTHDMKGFSFSLRDVGIEQEDAMRAKFTMDDNGVLIKLDKKISSDETIKIFNGGKALSLYIYSDLKASDYGIRYYIFGNNEPFATNNMIVGVPKGTQSNELLEINLTRI